MLYGDGVFDTLVVRNGKIFRLDDHIDRFYNSLKVVKIEIGMSKEEMRKAVIETISRSGLRDAYVRLVVTRGRGYPLLDPRYAGDPTIAILPQEFRFIVPEEEGKAEGLRAIIAKTRKTPSMCIESRAKTLNYLNNVLARIEAVEAGADEAILLDIHGFVTEGCGDNIFAVKGNTLSTPNPTKILEGITRRTIIEIARKEGYDVFEVDMTPYDLYTADEVFLTSTAGGTLPILSIDGRVIGDGKPGPVTKRLMSLYKEELVRNATPVFE